MAAPPAQFIILQAFDVLNETISGYGIGIRCEQQECIPVGCVPSAAVAVRGGLHQAPPQDQTPPWDQAQLRDQASPIPDPSPSQTRHIPTPKPGTPGTRHPPDQALLPDQTSPSRPGTTPPLPGTRHPHPPPWTDTHL